VTCVGGRTQWDVGGPVAPCREVSAPAGIVTHEPAEMTITCGAGTTLAALDEALAASGQMVPFDHPGGGATVGGVLAVGRSGIRRLRYGPVRDLLLAARVVMADGTVVTAGGPTVKNVSGYDLHRLHVGALGTLGFFAEVTLRCLPRPPHSKWFTSDRDPFELRWALHRPVTLLWDGTSTAVLLEGHPADVEAEAAVHGLVPAAGPPEIPEAARTSHPPADLRRLTGTFGAEVGVGVVHWAVPPPVDAAPPPSLALQHRLKATFDPDGRLNPGREVS
jgi:glycolate oxidase FAD binding subunit